MVVELWLTSRPSPRNLRPRNAWLGIWFQQHIYTPLCVLKARYLHRAYYTYVIHEITLESVQLYGHNSMLSGLLGARWLVAASATWVSRWAWPQMSPRPYLPASTKITIKRKPFGNLKLFFFVFLRINIGPYFWSNGHSSLNRYILKIKVKNRFINFLKIFF